MIPDDIMSDKITNVNSNESLRPGDNDPTLTLISVYSPNMSSNIQFNVQRSSASVAASKPSQLFSLFRLPKRTSIISTTTSNAQLLPIINGSVSNDNMSRRKTSLDTQKSKSKLKSKTNEKYTNNRFISIVRCIFCQCVPVVSTATVTPINDQQMPEESVDDNQTFATNTSAQIETPIKVK